MSATSSLALLRFLLGRCRAGGRCAAEARRRRPHQPRQVADHPGRSTSHPAAVHPPALLYKPLLAKMEERTQAIKKSLDEAQAARAEAQRQREENAAQLQAAPRRGRGDPRRGAEGGRRGAAQARRGRARRGASGWSRRAKAQLDADVRRAREELRREVSRPGRSRWPRSSIRKSLRDEDHRRIVADAIARLEN